MWSNKHENKKRSKSVIISSLLTLLITSGPVYAQSTPTELADITLEDLLDFEISDTRTDTKTRRWNFDHTYRKLSTGGYRQGTTDFSFDDVLFSPGEPRSQSNFPIVPTFISQEVHAFSGSYHLNDRLSLNLALPYIEQGTDHISSVPGFSEFLLKSKGMGDIAISGSYEKRISHKAALHFNIGARLPTGSINVKGDTPRNGAGTDERLPYTMQLGSGTFDITGTVSYSRIMRHIKFGTTTNATLRTHKNKHDYKLGNNFGAAGWIQLSKNQWFQPGIKLNIRHIKSIKGEDNSLIVAGPFPYPASISDPNNYGGTKAHLSAILKTCLKQDCSISLSGEFGKPIHQNLNGIQPKDRRHMSITASTHF